MSQSKAVTALSRLSHPENLTGPDAAEIVNEVYRDGVITREEAEAVFRLNETLALYDAHWSARFVEVMRDYLLTGEAPFYWVSEEEADWLIEQVMRDGHVQVDTEMELLLSLLHHAEGVPQRLSSFALEAVCERMRQAGRASLEEVERLRRVLFAPAGQGSVWVSREEANALFALNDDIGMAPNHKSWPDLFARAIANHLLAVAHPSPSDIGGAFDRERWLNTSGAGVTTFLSDMVASFSGGDWFSKVAHDPEKAAAARMAAQEAAARKAAVITDQEGNWYLNRLGWDRGLTPAEKALVAFLRQEAPGFVNGLATAA